MDPYTAKGWPRSAPESRTNQDQFLARMRDLGASYDELAAAADAWGLDAEEDERLLYMGDRELRAEIVAVRREYDLGTTSEEELAAQEKAREYKRAVLEASERVGGTIPSIMAWVGDDPVRARVVHVAETSPDGANRSTLLKKLDKILGPSKPLQSPSGVSTYAPGTDPAQVTLAALKGSEG